MNYSLLIQNRHSTRAFTSKKVSKNEEKLILSYFNDGVQRLIPEIKTELLIFGDEVQNALEGAAGYNDMLIGAPKYMVLLSESAGGAGLNAGYIMEDLILKLQDEGLGSCWITFTDSAEIKAALNISSELEVAAIAAFGYGQKSVKRMHVNIKSMSNVDIKAKRHYFDPKKKVSDIVFKDEWGNSEAAEEYIGFFDDMLWEAFYAASLSPSYLNRQPYGFLIKDGRLYLVKTADEYTTEIDSALDLGAALLHFTSVAGSWANHIKWSCAKDADLSLPEGFKPVAVTDL